MDINNYRCTNLIGMNVSLSGGWRAIQHILEHLQIRWTVSLHLQKWRWSGGRLKIKMSSYQYLLTTALSLTWLSPCMEKLVFILRRGPGELRMDAKTLFIRGHEKLFITFCGLLLINKHIWASFINMTLIPAWINNQMYRKVWDEITYAFPNFNCCTVEV